MWYGAALVTFAVLFWTYGPTLHTGFLFDDTKQQFAALCVGRFIWIGPVRPVLMFTYWFNTRISWWPQLRSMSSHPDHAVAGILIFLVIRRLLEWACVEVSAALRSRSSAHSVPAAPLQAKASHISLSSRSLRIVRQRLICRLLMARRLLLARAALV
jgi:hypothetical protein